MSLLLPPKGSARPQIGIRAAGAWLRSGRLLADDPGLPQSLFGLRADEAQSWKPVDGAAWIGAWRALEHAARLKAPGVCEYHLIAQDVHATAPAAMEGPLYRHAQALSALEAAEHALHSRRAGTAVILSVQVDADAAGETEVLALVLVRDEDDDAPVDFDGDREGEDLIVRSVKRLLGNSYEAPAAPPARLTPPDRISDYCREVIPWPLSARTSEDLESSLESLRRWLMEHPSADAETIGASLSLGRPAWKHRAVAIVRRGDVSKPSLWRLRALARAATSSSIAFLFPGQGAQQSGMAMLPYQAEPLFREAVDHCAYVLSPELHLDIRDLLIKPSDPAAVDPLTNTALAQPALFVMSYALARLWEHWGLQPDAMLGHSVGEWVAATLAGVFDLEDALRLVARRGRLMQSLPPGAMLAVTLNEAGLRGRLAPDVAVAAVNGPNACVASGPTESIAALEVRLRGEGVAVHRLKTSHAFHSAMMEPALCAFEDAVAGVSRRPPRRRFVSNLDGRWIEAQTAMSARYWASHIRGTVRFAQGLQCLLGAGCRAMIEVGPRRQLSGLLPKPDERPDLLSVASCDERGQCSGAALAHAVGVLWAHGAPIDWRAYWSRHSQSQVPRLLRLPGYPFDSDGFVTGTTPGRSPTVASIEF